MQCAVQWHVKPEKYECKNMAFDQRFGMLFLYKVYATKAEW